MALPDTVAACGQINALTQAAGELTPGAHWLSSELRHAFPIVTGDSRGQGAAPVETRRITDVRL
jgi:hypothetical protein